MTDYDMNIHRNPDAVAWAKFFVETTKDMDRDTFRNEEYMTTWFANAMMAMYDHIQYEMDKDKRLMNYADDEQDIRITKLEEALTEALEEWEYNTSYKGEYLTEKHDDANRIAEYRKMLGEKK